MGRISAPSSARPVRLPELSWRMLRFWWLPILLIGLVFGAGGFLPGRTVYAAPGDVQGVVYSDFNESGTKDQVGERGVAGITVSAYDAAGAQVATTTTIADGSYTLTIPTAGVPLRIEFTNLPTGYQTGAAGAGSGTTVQFVTAPAANVNLGVLKPSEYCQNNPQVASECYFFGANTGTSVIRRFPYESGTTSQTSNTDVETPSPTLLSTDTQVGATWGLAYARGSQLLYASAFMKRHMAFGPGGPGAIYQLNRNTGVASVLVDLNTVFAGNPAGTDSHTPTNRPVNSGEPLYFDDEGAWDGVGKTSFTGLDLSEDEQFLWTVTMSDGDRRLYKIPVSNPDATNIQRFDLPDPGTGASGCPANPATAAGELNRNLRPGAVAVRGDLVFVGLTCTAESTQLRSDLRAFVYSFDTTASTFTQVATFPLTYARGPVSTNGSQTINLATWEPWASAPDPGFPFGFSTDTVIPKRFAAYNQHYYPQPWLSDITFDEQGAMVVALMDRFGHQSGNRNGNAGSGPIEGVSAGDVLRLAPSGATWTIENNATAAGGPTGGAGNDQGPGGGEFYFHDRYPVTSSTPTHTEITLGGLAQRLGSNEILATAFDSPPGTQTIAGAPAYRTGGLIWLSNSTGQRTRSYLLYTSDQTRTFGKAAGIGDVELLCDLAPIEIGNRVWVDADRDGVQDAGEPPISGVAVRLFNGGGTQVGTTTTDANGGYYFNAANVTGGILTNTNYQIRIDTTQAPLAGFKLTTGDQGGNDAIDSDGTLTGNDAIISLTTGSAGANNHTYDFGFTSLSLGNYVWQDTNNNGAVDAGEPPISGVTLKLWLDDGDGVFNPASDTDTGLTATTDANGNYLFTGMAPGNYFVQIPPANFSAGAPLQLFSNSSGQATGDLNDRDHGVPSAPNGVVSDLVTLDFGTEPVDDGDADADSNLTIDFGFYPNHSLGNRVWRDLNNDGLDNDGAGTGIDGVTVNLYADTNSNGVLDAADAPISTDTTGGGGYYLFTGLAPGNYFAQLPSTNFTAGGALAGYTSSTGTPGSATGPYEGATTPDPNGDIDQDDNGNIGAGGLTTAGVTGGIVSKPLTLGPAADEPTGEGGAGTTPGRTDATPDNRSNLTLDFGVFQPFSLGNRVWNDANNDGLDNNGEAGIDGVTVNLLSAGAVVQTVQTTSGGYYLFTNLTAGDYTVQLPGSNFATGVLVAYTSSTGTPGSPTGPYEGALLPDPDSNIDQDDNGGIGAGGLLGTGVDGGVLSRPIALGPNSTEPVNEAGGNTTPGFVDPAPDNRSNLTLDFGVFQGLSLGNFVWQDTNNNGTVDAGETPIQGVTLALWLDDGDAVFEPGQDTNTGQTATTDAQGLYLFSGLAAGTYFVQIPPANFTPGNPLESLTNSSGQTTGDVNDKDHGAPSGTDGIVSDPVTLQPNGEPTDDGDTSPNTNLTIDFGFYPSYSLGNRVWRDADNDGLDNDGAGTGINGVTVNLFVDSNGDGTLDAGDAPAGTTTTSNGGYYLFTGLPAGSYLVQLPSTNFVAGALQGYSSSTGAPGQATGPYEGTDTPDPNDNVDEDDDGNIGTGGLTAAGVTGGIVSKPLVLGPGDSEPTNESGGNTTPGRTDSAPDNRSNLTLDFGVIQTVSLGDFVWVDADHNGVQDVGEAGIPDVTVTLYDAAGTTVIATTTTDAGGLYSFTLLQPGTNYVIRLDNQSDYDPSGPLAGYLPTLPNTGGDDTKDSDAILPTPGNPVGAGNYPTIPAITGGPGTNTPTFDAGFWQPLSLGNRVWNDLNNNGLDDDGAGSGIAGVAVNLLDGGGAVVATTTTSPQGYYLFVDLVPGTYTVELPASNFTGAGSLVGYTGSTGTFASATGPYEPGSNDNADANDNGTLNAGGIRSGAVALAYGTAPTGEPATPGLTDTATDANSNLTIDFGVFQGLSLGNKVWVDTNNNGLDNEANTGIGNVTVNLLDAGGAVVATTTTSPQGYYLFVNLQPGTYTVELPASNFTGTGALVGYASSTGTANSPTGPYEPGNNGNADANDNGSGVGGGIRSGPITLAVGTAPTGEPATPGLTDTASDDNSNLTIDFGVIQTVGIGDFIWNDADHDGVQDVGEAGIPGVTVTLYDAAGTTVVATTTTDANGNYIFSYLQPGTNYVIRLDNPADYTGNGPLTNYLPTLPNVGSDTSDSDAALPTPGSPIGAGNFPTIPATSGSLGSSTLTFDAGFWQPLSLGNRVWNDINNNGLDDDGPTSGIAGVTVLLLDAGGNAVGAPQTTNAQGYYLFTNLVAGSYSVQIPASNFATGAPLAGFVTSTGTNGAAAGPYEPGNGGTADANDNGSAASGGITSAPVALAAGTAPTGEPATPGFADATPDANSNLTIDFGVFQRASLGSFVWNDVNGNGVRENGDNGVAGVTVTLYDANGNVVATTTTDASGLYQFTNLIPGIYSIGFSNLPVGTVFTAPGLGSSNPGGDSRVDPATGRTGPIDLSPGENDPTIWAGIKADPTAIDLVSFTATREGGKVVLRWVTAREVSTVGFNIYRSADGTRANAVKLTLNPIASRGGSERGASYTFEDGAPIDGAQYWLEELEAGGMTRFYGPATAQGLTREQVRVLVPMIRR